jgi:hypothetical protein
MTIHSHSHDHTAKFRSNPVGHIVGITPDTIPHVKSMTEHGDAQTDACTMLSHEA